MSGLTIPPSEDPLHGHVLRGGGHSFPRMLRLNRHLRSYLPNVALVRSLRRAGGSLQRVSVCMGGATTKSASTPNLSRHA